MSLISRLSGIPEPDQSWEDVKKIGFNQFISALYEYQQGSISVSGIVDQFDLDAGEQAEALFAKIQWLANNSQRESFLLRYGNILHLAALGFNDSANGGRDYGLLPDIEARIGEL